MRHRLGKLATLESGSSVPEFCYEIMGVLHRPQVLEDDLLAFGPKGSQLLRTSLLTVSSR